MTKKQRHYIVSTIEQEGFDYCMRDYLDWSTITKDKNFIKVYNRYLHAEDALKEAIQYESTLKEIAEGKCPKDCPCDIG